MVAHIVWEFVNLGNYTLMMVTRQLGGALRMYLNMDGCPIIREIRNSRVQGGGIWELKNSSWELYLYEGYKAT